MMKRLAHRLLAQAAAVGVAALLLAGCARDSGSQPSATGGQVGTGGSPSSSESASASRQSGGPTKQGEGTAAKESVAAVPGPGADSPRPAASTAEAAPAAAQPGEPGSIKGVVKSPYIRLAQGVVFIARVDGLEFKPPKQNVVMDQKNLIFIPHVLPVLVGTTVDFPNSDTVRHNVYSFKDSPQQFNLGQYDVGVVKHVTFDKVGVTHLRCNVHAEMSAYVVVCQNPYFAVTDGSGNFVIPNVPPGKWQLRLFHEKLKEKTIEVTVEPAKETVVEFSGLERA